jgi:drug/metabolite transporter (DMT)-like permease
LGYAFLTSTVALGFLFFGMENTTVLDSTLITLANPLLVTLAGVWFLKEHVTTKEKLGMTIALIGTLLIVIEPIIQGGNGIKLSGNVLIIGYLIATAWSAVLAKQVLRENISPTLMTNMAFIVGFITLLPIGILSHKLNIGSIFATPINYHFGVFYMAFFSGTLAYYLGNKAQKSIEIGEAAVFSYLYPLFATPLAVIWLGEKVTPIFIIGGIIIILGVILAEWKKRRYN